MVEHKRAEHTPIDPGQPVYDGDGKLVGIAGGPTDDGFEVETVDPEQPDNPFRTEIPGQEFGEGYLMWRCTECGEMGELDDGIPSTCPNCDAPKTDIMYWTED